VINKIFIVAVLIVLSSAGGAVAAERLGQLGTSPFFLEMWNYAAFMDTNLERKNFSSVLGRYEGKLGLNLFDFPLQVYGVYYGVASQANDYWDNSLFDGSGVRLIPFRDYPGTGWYNEWLQGMKFYVESLGSSYQKNAVSAEALSKTDSRYGIEIYHEWNLENPNPKYPWAELWANYSRRETNFGWEPFNDYVFYCQPKIGMLLADGIRTYVKADVTTSGKSGPSYSFLNVADYGVGIRFEPWRTKGRPDDLLKKFKMFAEFLGVSYLKDKPVDPNKQVSSDVRFGIEFSYGR
jgi:hypothetical protein